MKKLLAIFFILEIISISALYAQNDEKCDYIASGYYQLVYEAEIAWGEGNDSTAFDRLQKAEACCPILNQLESQEMEMFSELLLKNEQYDKALFYMGKLATEYGKIPFLPLEKIQNDSILSKKILAEYPAFYDSIYFALIQKRDDFYTPERQMLTAQLTEWTNEDQNIRYELIDALKKADTLSIASIRLRMNRIDSINAVRFLDFISKYGFPNARIYGENNRLLNGKIAALLMHLGVRCIENLDEIVLEYIRRGECGAHVYGSIVDKRILESREKKYLYAIFSNTKDDEIDDIEHLDERRIAVGMPTRETERRIRELIDSHQ
jgi:hypothetical protein